MDLLQAINFLKELFPDDLLTYHGDNIDYLLQTLRAKYVVFDGNDDSGGSAEQDDEYSNSNHLTQVISISATTLHLLPRSFVLFFILFLLLKVVCCGGFSAINLTNYQIKSFQQNRRTAFIRNKIIKLLKIIKIFD